VAGRLGWRRRRSGENANGFDDNVLQDGSLAPISIEAKANAVLQLRTDWLIQAERNAGLRPWIVVQRPLRRRHPIVSMEWPFFEHLLVAAGYIDQGEAENVQIQSPSLADSRDDAEVVGERGKGL
jgi:hypothetical protein